MTDTQLDLAIGIPALLFAPNFLAILWQARGLERAFNARFAAVASEFKAQTQGLLRVEGILDARLKHLEERER